MLIDCWSIGYESLIDGFNRAAEAVDRFGESVRSRESDNDKTHQD